MKKLKSFQERPCTQCEAPYKHYATTKHTLCDKCRQSYYNKMQRLKPDERKKPYPLSKSEKLSRHRRIKKELSACLYRREWQALLKKNIEDIMDNGIWTWCVDVRLPEVPKGYDRPGRQPKIENQYPNTRNAEL
jgi:hypothetical protein